MIFSDHSDLVARDEGNDQGFKSHKYARAYPL